MAHEGSITPPVYPAPQSVAQRPVDDHLQRTTKEAKVEQEAKVEEKRAAPAPKPAPKAAKKGGK